MSDADSIINVAIDPDAGFYTHISNRYYFNTPMFAFLGKYCKEEACTLAREHKLQKMTTLKQISSMFRCRELFTETIKSAIYTKCTDGFGYMCRLCPPKQLDLSALRILLCVNCQKSEQYKVEQKMQYAISLVNLLETAASFQYRSNLTPVGAFAYKRLPYIHYDTESNVHSFMWVLEGSAEWLYTSQILSLLGLLIRLAFVSSTIPITATSVWDEIAQQIYTKFTQCSESSAIDKKYYFDENARAIEHFSYIYKYILPIVKNMYILFDADLNKRYPATTQRGYGGIFTYVHGAINGTLKNDMLEEKFHRFVLNTTK